MKYILVLGLLFFAHYSISNNDLISNIDTLVISLNRKIAEMETSAYKAHNQADFMKRNADVATQKIADLENIREISLIELLVNTLPEKVGSPLSIKGLMEDLQIDHKTVEKWIL